MCLLNILRLHIIQNQRQKKLYKKYTQEYMDTFVQNTNEFTMVRYNDHFTMVPSSPGYSSDTNVWSTYPASKSTRFSEGGGRPSSCLFLPPPDEMNFGDEFVSEACPSCCQCEDDSGRYSSLCCSEFIFNGNQHLGGNECYPDGSYVFIPEEWSHMPDGTLACL